MSSLRMPRLPGFGRGGLDVYQRRRLVAIGLVAAVVVVGFLVLRGCGEDEPVSAQEALRQERDENPVELTVSVSGDLLIHSPIYARALELGGSSYDFAPMLAPIRAHIAGADLAFCHLETPLAPGVPQSYPVFRTPPDLARAVKEIGWDACTTASNHSLDQGEEGIASTARALDRAGLPHTGSFSSARERKRPLILEAKGVGVAWIAYTDATNGIPLPSPWAVNLAEDADDVDRVLADARRARRQGAEVVLVNMHWGPEGASEPDADQREQARLLAASPLITAVVGQGPHVVQPIERLSGKPIVYSEGNLISNQDAACCPEASQDGLIALLEILVDGDGATVERVRYVPVWVEHPTYEVLPVGDALAGGRADPASLRASYERTVAVAGRGAGIEPDPARLPR
jgi:poly-gamma-glutamate synthesis protein (capsule biosynthesis protein)